MAKVHAPRRRHLDTQCLQIQEPVRAALVDNPWGHFGPRQVSSEGCQSLVNFLWTVVPGKGRPGNVLGIRRPELDTAHPG